MKLTLINGKPAVVRDNGQAVFHSIYMGTRYWGNMYNVLRDYEGKSWTVRECALDEAGNSEKDFSVLESPRCFIAECENARLYAAMDERTALFKTEVKNEGGDKDPFDVIALGGLYANRLDRALCGGFTTFNGLKQTDMNASSLVKILAENDYCESGVHMPVLDKQGQAVNFGFITYEKYFTSIFACEGGTVEFRHFLDGKKLLAGQTLASDWMLISLYEDMVSELPNFAKLVSKFNRFDKPKREVPVGFSSWYYYMGNINERTIYENLAAIDKIKDRVPLQVFQIDAGWAPGNHHGNTDLARFPKGMKFYADLIKEHGLTPGIWLSPFNVDENSDLVKEHPEWFVKHEDGSFTKHGANCMLDVTHPGAKQYVRDLYRMVTYDWGYRYLKLDMVSENISAGCYYDPQAGALQNVREYFRLVREASHPDTYILACTSPMFEVSEFVDGVRIAVDIFERWESLLKEFNRIFKRYYMNDNLFISDPDCLMIRKKENEDEDCRRFCSRTDDEIRTFLTAIYAAGGALLISDKLPLMSEEQIALYEKLFPWTGRAAKPLDLMESFVPGLLDLGYEEGIRTVAFINWGERERTFTLPLDGTHSATEHWTDENLGTVTGEYKITLAPHCSSLVHFKKQ